MAEQKIRLPERNQMLTALRAACDVDHLCERLYPLLLREAGHTKYRSAVPLMVELACYDYLQGLPPQVGVVLEMHKPALIQAIQNASTVVQDD